MTTRQMFINTAEAGNMSEWESTSGTIVASSASPLSGSWSVLGGTGGAAAGTASESTPQDAATRQGGRCGRYYMRGLYRPATNPAGANISILTNGSVGIYQAEADDKPYAGLATAVGVKASAALSTGTTYTFEAMFIYAGNGELVSVKWWIDGTEQTEWVISPAVTTTVTSGAAIGTNSAKCTWQARFDDIEGVYIPSWN